MRVSKTTTSELSLDLLLLYENDKHHYVLIKDFCRLFSKTSNSGQLFTYAGTVFTCVTRMLNNLKIMLKIAVKIHQLLSACQNQTIIYTNSLTGQLLGLLPQSSILISSRFSNPCPPVLQVKRELHRDQLKFTNHVALH